VQGLLGATVARALIAEMGEGESERVDKKGKTKRPLGMSLPVWGGLSEGMSGRGSEKARGQKQSLLGETKKERGTKARCLFSHLP